MVEAVTARVEAARVEAATAEATTAEAATARAEAATARVRVLVRVRVSTVQAPVLARWRW